jgi:4-hydroxythreonine-4-phosphate dehydrogenase
LIIGDLRLNTENRLEPAQSYTATPATKPLAVTMGDPAGIGPDIALLAWTQQSVRSGIPFFLIGDANVLTERAALLGLRSSLAIKEIEGPEEAPAIFERALPILPLHNSAGFVEAGKPRTEWAPAIIASIEAAVAFAAAGRAAAIVTSPIAKYVLMQHGFSHAGHTEFLAELATRHGHSDVYPVMLMASPCLKAIPVTVHIPLKEVPHALTPARLIRVAEVTSNGLSRYFGIANPRLSLCGLNPHAGENGELGREEIEIIAPAIAELNAKGILASGPYSADSLFHEAARENYDAVLAMYHDQALIPFKTLSFDDGVNVTLGLPFVRTSPDHGTAFSLAGTGRANPASFIEALSLAGKMARTSLTAPASGLDKT